VPLLRQIYNAINQALGREDKHFLESSTFVATPLIAAMASFVLYPTTSIWFHNTVNFFSNNNWERKCTLSRFVLLCGSPSFSLTRVSNILLIHATNKTTAVDGGQLQWSILLPALNGVVMTAISLLYANLISTTGTQLRTRQITIHSSLSHEIEGLRGLIQLIAYYPEHCRAYFANFIQVYLMVLVKETDPDQQQTQQVRDLRSVSPPLSDYRDGLHSLSVGYGASDTNIVEMNGNILERSYETLQRLFEARNERVTSLQTKFPGLHYVTITALSAAILLIFLLETDRKIILFLDKFQIQTVWSLLVGTVTAIYCIGLDLTQPFVGTYTVPAEQLLEDNDELLALIQNLAVISTAPTISEALPSQEFTVMQEAGVPVAARYEETWQQPAQPYANPTMEEFNVEHSPTVTANDSLSLYEEYMKGRNQ
jgi:hypothetical protein